MCSLIVLRGVSADHPLVIAANRDERTDRKASPPGLFHGDRRRMLSPRDRLAGGTWLAVDDLGRFAGLTNVFGQPPVVDAPSRGHLPHLALDQHDLDAGVAAVLRKLDQHPHSAFQLVLADARRIVVVRHVAADVQVTEWTAPVLALSNEHPPGAWSPRGLEPALRGELPIDERLAALATVLRDQGGDGRHRVCKHGEHYGTVSSSLVAVPRAGVGELIWRFAPGPPDRTTYRNYGNLGPRLLEQSA